MKNFKEIDERGVFDITIDILLSKDEQTRIDINNDDVEHIRPPVQKLTRILEAYTQLQAELDKLKRINIEALAQLSELANDVNVVASEGKLSWIWHRVLKIKEGIMKGSG